MLNASQNTSTTALGPGLFVKPIVNGPGPFLLAYDPASGAVTATTLTGVINPVLVLRAESVTPQSLVLPSPNTVDLGQNIVETTGAFVYSSGSFVCVEPGIYNIVVIFYPPFDVHTSNLLLSGDTISTIGQSFDGSVTFPVTLNVQAGDVLSLQVFFTADLNPIAFAYTSVYSL